MNTMAAGRQAESVAANYLVKAGYRVLERNWRTRYCEIDIIAEKDTVIYFIEVKYRRTCNQGSGFDYITPRKLDQMRFASEVWVMQQGWQGDCRLGAIEISGEAFKVENFLSDCL